MREAGPVNVFKQSAITVRIDLGAPGVVCAIEQRLDAHTFTYLVEFDPRQTKVVADFLRSHVVHDPQCSYTGQHRGHVAMKPRAIRKTVAPQVVEPRFRSPKLIEMVSYPKLVLSTIQ